MELTLRVRPDVARALHVRGSGTSASQELGGTAAEMGGALEPMHPGSDDPQLARYFTVHLPDATDAEAALARLRRCEAVDAAYVKPQDEPP